MGDDLVLRVAAGYLGAQGAWGLGHPRSFDKANWVEQNVEANPGATRWLSIFMLSNAGLLLAASGPGMERATKKRVLGVAAATGSAAVAGCVVGMAQKTDRRDTAVPGALFSAGLAAWAAARALKKD
ncbi:hypothetical protein HYH03_008690 [Edaphochlamys debaryana]|uniref:Uncharacterized protein n=1 Tax=Edaphochlamys debaryana TaxID=47281 RepID=A0A835Y0J9_9CHLO|nr:hypothetical protein HYH03_008690 [Edaphochlamys debaryana]|eukprot:KAG2493027.1 hypothetical protein HYH03_008690 [Edaphochlamys debaryana]